MKPAARPKETFFRTCRQGSEALRRDFAQRLDELVQHDGGDQAGGADEA
jgi:hypothetical protein